MWPFKKKKQVIQKSYRSGNLLPGWSSRASWNDWSSDKAVMDGFESNVWVYACMKKRMNAASSVPLIVVDQEGKETEGAMLELFNRPNPSMDFATLIKVIIGSLDAGGNFYAHVIRRDSDGLPLELWPLQSDCVTPLVSDQADGRFISGYRYEHDNYQTIYKASEVMHLMYPHPSDRYQGISPLRAGGKAVDVDNEASTWQKISLQNRGVPDGVFTLQGDVSMEDYEQARRQVREQYAGVNNAREPWVVANASWHQMTLTPAELDFVASRAMTRTEICAVFEVPPPMVGVYDDATLANIETARKIFWMDTITPLLSDLKRAFNQFGEDYLSGNKLMFDLSNVEALSESLESKLDSARKLQELGVPLTVINKHLELGLDTDEIPGSDVSYVPSGLMPTDLDFDDIGNLKRMLDESREQ